MHFPVPTMPEIAFLGRSNVGKSSVLNSLVGEKIARTSGTPGRTRTINFFEVRRPGQPRPEMMFADLPGYGYAKLPRELTAEWPKFIEPYLNTREVLALCVALVDCKIATQASDLQLVDWLRTNDKPFVLVATKADRLSGNERVTALKRLAGDFGLDRVLPYSAKTTVGRDELWQVIWEAAGALVQRGA